MLLATTTTPMTVSECKDILNLSGTTYDNFFSANLYSVAKYVNDWSNNGLAYKWDPTLSGYTQLQTSNSATSSNATLMPWLVEGSVIVFSSAQAKRYTEDHDYELNYELGTLVYLNGSTYGTSTGGYALVHYEFIYPRGGAKTVIAKLLKQSYDYDPKITSESVGGLSRSYSGDMPAEYVRLLKPYRKARFR
jgi:hypothetical protein